ncbi:BnaA02g14360D [Brassica napus]|uniref:BnaA02g14360D protein n=1 Tax=Brassica napus TaxID=3708 RepID=A0A078I1Y6_BRANA|nr:BnaA02g14360D [Brassica napus]
MAITFKTFLFAFDQLLYPVSISLLSTIRSGTKRVMRSRKKITPPVSHKPFIAETFVTPCGIKTKVWRLPESALNGPVMDSALDEDSDESDGYLHRELGCGCNPHEPVLSNSSVPHIKNRIKVSLGYTRRCKLNVLRRRRRRQRLAHKLIKNRAPSVPSSNFIQVKYPSL